MTLIVPAVLPSSRKDLEEKLALFSRIPSVSRVQIDIVDGKFASPASWPYTAPQEFREFIKQGEMLPHLDRLAYEIDLMCFDAEQAAGVWLALGATRLTFHIESVTNMTQLLTSVRARYGAGGFMPLVSFGLALNVATDLALIEPHLADIEYVQFMGISRIGRQGQLFDRHVPDKLRAFRMRHPDIAIQVDGGVSLDVARKLVLLDIPTFIVGSAIGRASDPVAALAAFEELNSPYGV